MLLAPVIALLFLEVFVMESLGAYESKLAVAAVDCTRLTRRPDTVGTRTGLNQLIGCLHLALKLLLD